MEIPLETFSKSITLFAVLREIQLLAYFQEKNKDKESPSVSTSIAILEEE